MSSTDLCYYALCPLQPWRERSGIGRRDPGSEKGLRGGEGHVNSHSRHILLDLCIDVSPSGPLRCSSCSSCRRRMCIGTKYSWGKHRIFLWLIACGDEFDRFLLLWVLILIFSPILLTFCKEPWQAWEKGRICLACTSHTILWLTVLKPLHWFLGLPCHPSYMDALPLSLSASALSWQLQPLSKCSTSPRR